MITDAKGGCWLEKFEWPASLNEDLSKEDLRADAGNPVQVLGISDLRDQLEEQVATGTYQKVTARAA